jgi:hypothetical protein
MRCNLVAEEIQVFENSIEFDGEGLKDWTIANHSIHRSFDALHANGSLMGTGTWNPNWI